MKIWSNRYWNIPDEAFDEYKALTEEANEQEYSDEQIWEFLADRCEEDRINLAAEMQGYSYSRIVLFGTWGRWDGSHSVHQFMDNANWKDILNSCNDFQGIEFFVDDDGELNVICSDHDGNSFFTIRKLEYPSSVPAYCDGSDDFGFDIPEPESDMEEDYEKMAFDDFLEKYSVPIGFDYLKEMGIKH